MANVIIDNCVYYALFDTGAEITLISGSKYDRTNPSGSLIKSTTPLSTANGGALEVRGEKICSFVLAGQKIRHRVIIVDGLSVDCIIGADLMTKHQISIDTGGKRIKIGSFDGDSKSNGKFPLKTTRKYTIEPHSEQALTIGIPSELRGAGKSCMLVEPYTEKVTMIDALYDPNQSHCSLYVRNLTDSPMEICRGETIASGRCIDKELICQPNEVCKKTWEINSVQNRRSTTMLEYMHEVKNKLLSVPGKYYSSYANLLKQYVDVFSVDTNDVGRCDVIKQKIVLSDNNKVCSTPPYRLPHNLLSVAHAYVRKLLQNDIIRPSKSPFSSPLMLVKKPGIIDPNKPIEEQYRVVHDYRRLNANTVKDAYPMRNLFELIDEVSQGNIFSIIDLSQGFWNQELEETSKSKTAFGVPGLGHFEYNRSAQGLCNSGAAFQRLLDYVTSGINGVYVYIDDIVIVSKTHEEHLMILDKVLQRFRKFGLKCRLRKLQLATAEVNYLGYNISSKYGIRPGEIKTEAIRKWQPPKDVKEIKQFLGLCSFFRKTIPYYSQLASPLTRLTRKDSTWKAGVLPNIALKAFCQLKQKLSSRPCLAAVDFSLPFILTVDSSGLGVGSILSQVGRDGTERPCAYASRVLTPAEEKYAPSHLEAAGLLWSCKHFRPYLIGREFTIRTDHKPLLALNKMNGFALDRIHAELQDYMPFVITYMPGEKMPADGLSRQTRLGICTTSQLKLPWTVQLSADQLYHLQTEDKYIKAVVCAKRYNQWPRDSALNKFVRALQDEVIFQQGIAGIMRKNVFLALAPYHIRPTLLQLAHDDALAGHLGWMKTLGRLQLAWYWPNMAKEVENYCQSCHICQSTNPPHGKGVAPLEPLPTVTRFNERLHVDLLGPLPMSHNGNKYLLVMSDAFSSYMEVMPLKDKTANNVSIGLLNGWIANHTLPERINSDLGSEFTANVFKELCEKLGIRQFYSSAMHPMSNGQVERLNRSIVDYLRKFISNNQEWEEMLPGIKFALNTAPHSTKKYSPYQIVYGRRPTLSTTLLSPVKSYSDEDSLMLLSTMANVAQDVAKLQQAAFQNQKNMFDRQVRLNKICTGDLVYITRPHKGKLFQKFQQTYEGPFIVVQCLGHQNYILKAEKGQKMIRVHHNRIKLAKLRWQLYDEREPTTSRGEQTSGYRVTRQNRLHEEYLNNFRIDKRKPIYDDQEDLEEVGEVEPDNQVELGPVQGPARPPESPQESPDNSLPSTPDSNRTLIGPERLERRLQELQEMEEQVGDRPVDILDHVQVQDPRKTKSTPSSPGNKRAKELRFGIRPTRPPTDAHGASALPAQQKPVVKRRSELTSTSTETRPAVLTRRRAEARNIVLPEAHLAEYPTERKQRKKQ